jgi:hypothetical protein
MAQAWCLLIHAEASLHIDIYLKKDEGSCRIPPDKLGFKCVSMTW